MKKSSFFFILIASFCVSDGYGAAKTLFSLVFFNLFCDDLYLRRDCSPNADGKGGCTDHGAISGGHDLGII